jgi:hypothetical protein
MYKQFKTDTDLEKEGIDLNYGDFIVKVARAGGGNKKFARVLEAKMKPVRRAVQTESLDNKRAEALMREAYAEGVVLMWSVRVKADDKGKPVEPLQLMTEGDGNTVFVQGIEGPDGDVLPFNVENVVATFQALPELFADIREQSGKMGLFRQAGQEADAGN